MKTKLIRGRVCPDCQADPKTIEGSWHGYWRLPDSETCAFYHGGKWYASHPRLDGKIMLCVTKDKALNFNP